MLLSTQYYNSLCEGALYCAQLTKNTVDLLQLSIHSETNEFVQRHIKFLNFENATSIDLVNLDVAVITEGNSSLQLHSLFEKVEKGSECQKYQFDEVIKRLKY